MSVNHYDVRKIGKEILNDFIVLIVEMDVDKIEWDVLYRKCYALSSSTYYAPAHEDGLKMLQRLLLFATRLLAIECEGDTSDWMAQEAFTMLRYVTMHYHRLYTSERWLVAPRADIRFATVYELALVEFERHRVSLRARTMRACKSKFLEMAERAKFAVRARPGGEDFVAVQNEHVSTGRMMM